MATAARTYEQALNLWEANNPDFNPSDAEVWVRLCDAILVPPDLSLPVCARLSWLCLRAAPCCGCSVVVIHQVEFWDDARLECYRQMTDWCVPNPESLCNMIALY